MPSLKHLLLITAFTFAPATMFAQPPGGGPGRPGGPGGPRGNSPPTSVADLVTKILKFDANKDDSLAKSELNDERLQPLFERADADHDGTATRKELTDLFTTENAALASTTRGGGPGGSGPGPGPGATGEGRGPSGDGGPRGVGEPGAGGPPSRPGQILSGDIQDRLRLTTAQKKRVEALQKTVDLQLSKILTPEQVQMLNEPGPPPGGPREGGPPPRGPREGGPFPGGPREGGPFPGGPREGGPSPGGAREGGSAPERGLR